MENEILLKSVEIQIKSSMKMLSQASDTIIEQGVSSYPIFVLHRLPIEIGISLREAQNLEADWHIRASTLEEFVTRQVIDSDKVDDFKKVYKPTESHLCLFVVDKSGATFVFLPHSK